jgi:hypothetical protein
VRYAKRIATAAVTAALVLTGGSAAALSVPSVVPPEAAKVHKVRINPQMLVSVKPAQPRRVPTLVMNYNHDDMHGYRPSVYQGRYYKASQESFRKCVMMRESSYRYGARNRSGSSAAGAYQFLDNAWRKNSGSLPWMMHAENKKVYGSAEAKKILRVLKSTPIERWGRAWQDQAFFTALNFNGAWSGKKHWNATVPGTGC